MAKLKIILLALSITISCTTSTYDDINDYKGCVIIKLDPKIVGVAPIYSYNVYIKDTLDNYKVIIIQRDIAELFSEGDTI
jgi:hypothetical protein